MYGYGARVTLDNDGSIDVTSGSNAALGMLGVGYETSAVSNGATGAIVAHGNAAFGLVSEGDVATGTNAGDISVHGGQLAIAMQGGGMYDGSTVSLENSATGTLYATVSNKYGTAEGIVGNSGGDVHIANAGGIDVRNGRSNLRRAGVFGIRHRFDRQHRHDRQRGEHHQRPRLRHLRVGLTAM